MTPEELTARNQANAQHSTGPKTPEGKRRSSLNAYRSGLHGQIVCATPEDLAVFQKFCDEIRAELAPAGPTENYLATSIAEDMWRLQRARALENGIFAQGFRDHVDGVNSGHPEVDTALAQSQTWAAQAHQLQLLTVYEGRIRRGLEKNRAELKALQAERKTVAEKARGQAALFMQLAESNGESYQPGEDFLPASAHGGFVFSAPEINRRRDRETRLAQAWRRNLEMKNYALEPAASAESPRRVA